MNIIITGGSSGLGAAVVKTLAAKEGNNVYFTYANSVAAAQAIESEFPQAKAIHCDFSDTASVQSFLDGIPALAPDVLINNAYGNIHKEHFYRTNPDVFLKSFELNVMPTLKITQEAIKVFRKKKFGKIINIITSAIVNKPPVGWAEYAANKSYLLAMSKVWATECIKFNITSNSVSPSFMQTKLTGDTDERVIESMLEAHPLRKLLTPQEAADAVVFYVTASAQINGTHLVLNAGSDIMG